MQWEYIKTYDNRILGSIETDANGNQTARDWPSQRILGYYQVAFNRTVDFYGHIMSQGNTVINLIYREKNKK